MVIVLYISGRRIRDIISSSGSSALAASTIYHPTTNQYLTVAKMVAIKGISITLCVLVSAILIFNLLTTASATYRKPPFNGSIFGKRGNSIEYDSAGKALSAMCEIASEACQAWFPSSDSK